MMVLLMFFEAMYFGHFLSFYTMQLEPPKKEGYKTKTSSTSSVTLTLTKIEYWDRAGGVRNIV